ncbi:MAG: hypothetical protein P4L86_02460, partial [Mycobacterium sp.]|nr:hypothetical protein [Mycobacterium sp.]
MSGLPAQALAARCRNGELPEEDLGGTLHDCGGCRMSPQDLQLVRRMRDGLRALNDRRRLGHL